MSRQIDLSKPLSDEDRQYLVDRADTLALERNAALMAGASFENPVTVDDGDGDQGGDPQHLAVEDMNVEQLKNALHALDLPVSGNKEELQMRLTEARGDSDK